jgi:pimeloyl-ACP methyl ester carboxylesterase
MITASIAAPHPDIELGIERSPLSYFVCAPDAGLNRNTGLVVFIGGHGMDPGGGYVQSLLSYLANRHNCLAASVRYFGADLYSGARFAPMPDFFAQFAKHYGVTASVARGTDISGVVRQLAELLKQNGITAFHADCRVAVISDAYNSMGFLPALDHLQVIHRLLDEHALDRRRLYVIGTSYGGYIASLMTKLAPNTLRMVIDNSGYSSAEDDLPGLTGTYRIWVGDVAIGAHAVRCWSFDPSAANYFGDPRREIRSLLEARHVCANTARVYAYHTQADTVASLERKLPLRGIYAGRVAYDLQIVDEAALDGRVFKKLEHGMDASMRGLFDLSYEKYIVAGGACADHCDFDLEHEVVFPCSGEDYVLRYSRRDGVSASLRASADM